MINFLRTIAVTLVGDNSGTNINIEPREAEDILQNGLNIAYFLGGTIAIIVIIIGGIMYAISGGNSGSVTKAKNMILYSVVGLVLVIAAWAITNFVIVNF